MNGISNIEQLPPGNEALTDTSHIVELPSKQTAELLTPEQVDSLLTELQGHARRRRVLSNVCNGLKWSMVGNTGVGLFSYIYHSIRSGKSVKIGINWNDWAGIVSSRAASSGREVSFGGLWIALTAVMVVSFVGVWVATRRQLGLSRTLPSIGEPRALGLLVEAMHLGDERLRKEARDAAIPLLRSISTDFAGVLSKSQRELLHGELMEDDEELRDAVLIAMERVGNENDVEGLEELLDFESEPQRLASIQSCITKLSDRIAFDKATSMLLRPATQTSTHQDRLLRPSHLSAVDQTQLLRPSDIPSTQVHS